MPKAKRHETPRKSRKSTGTLRSEAPTREASVDSGVKPATRAVKGKAAKATTNTKRAGATASARQTKRATSTDRTKAAAPREIGQAADAAGSLHTRLVAISRRLARETGRLSFALPVAHVYAPLEYAREPHERYLALAQPGIDALLVGMNPGPFGMAQTGVPFGEIAAVREYLRLDGRVHAPEGLHPKRPVEGFACARSEVSGQRFWGLFARAFPERDACFRRIFVWNFCPLAFVSETGANLTPDKLPAAERAAIEAPCDAALRAIAEALGPRLVIGVGAFARAVAERALADAPPSGGFAQILHPSPASPAANRGWEPQARAELVRLGVIAGESPK
jgi:single-strand selective monofunctional uracil DNA glycosylase